MMIPGRCDEKFKLNEMSYCEMEWSTTKRGLDYERPINFSHIILIVTFDAFTKNAPLTAPN